MGLSLELCEPSAHGSHQRQRAIATTPIYDMVPCGSATPEEKTDQSQFFLEDTLTSVSRTLLDMEVIQDAKILGLRVSSE